mgnify:CR=1 FL=1
MSHRLYQTEGLILAAHHYGEANNFYQILTSELGLIGVSAQGVRYLKSKLRLQLRNLDCVNLTLVQGREVWRLTGAQASRRLDGILFQPQRLRVWARVANLVRRLMPGEQAQPELFTDLLCGLEALGEKSLTELDSVEMVIVLRLLHALGYVKSTAELSPWLEADFWSRRALSLEQPESGKIMLVINHSLAQSQL